MTTTAKTPKVELFRGTGWEECDAFVRSIREIAWKEDKLDDDRWIANYASVHFSGKALRWHSRLPPDVRRDWSKLEIALLDQWPTPFDDDDDDDADNAEISIVPIPAAAPDHSNNSDTPGYFHTVIKITSIDSDSEFYLERPRLGSDKCGLTKEIHKAMRVFVDVRNNPHTIEVSPQEGQPRHDYSWAGIHWYYKSPLIKRGSDSWARIALINSLTLKSSYLYPSSPFRIIAWEISPRGDIIPTWFHGNQKTTLGVFLKETSLTIALAADSNIYAAENPSEVRARMFLERLQ